MLVPPDKTFNPVTLVGTLVALQEINAFCVEDDKIIWLLEPFEQIVWLLTLNVTEGAGLTVIEKLWGAPLHDVKPLI